MFVTVSPLHLSLIFVDNAGAYPSEPYTAMVGRLLVLKAKI
jgi:hypothetical protein